MAQSSTDILTVKIESSMPRLAIVHDHPANWTGGGTLLLKRLFEEYPNNLHYVSAFPAPDRVRGWAPIEFSTDAQANMGRSGLGRIRLIYSLLPFSQRAKKLREYFLLNKIEVIHAVAHEYLWIPALWAAKSLNIPYLLAVHDHWPTTVRPQFPPILSREIFKFCVRRAKNVIGSHPEMGDLLLREAGVGQIAYEMDGLTVAEVDALRRSQANQCKAETFTIGFSGMYRTYREEFKVLQSAIRKLATTGLKVKIAIYSDLKREELEAEGWKPGEFCNETWIPYHRVVERLASCDACFLPMSFNPLKQEAMQWGIPGKTSQYVKTGKPVLVFAPSYSSIAKLANQNKLGYVLTNNSVSSLTEAIRTVLLDAKFKNEDRCKKIPDCLNFESVKKTIWVSIRNAANHG